MTLPVTTTSSLEMRARPRIVVIGGGTGTSVALSGLKDRDVELTAIVTAFDSGGSSGRLKEEFGHLSLGDLRQCLLALSKDSPETEAFRVAAQYRFSDKSSLNGHNLGNLFLSALTVMHSDIELAVQMMSRMLRIEGTVLPVSLEPADLCAELIDGSVLRGEATIDLRRLSPPPIRRVYLDRPAQPNPRALEAIREADAIVLGPGDLYTSIVPNLLVAGVAEAINESRGKAIYVCNLMTKHGETDGFGAAKFCSEISRYLGSAPVDVALINSERIPAGVAGFYASLKARQVDLNRSTDFSGWSRARIYAPLFNRNATSQGEEPRARHDAERLADQVIALAGSVTNGTGSPVADWENARSAD